MPILAVEPNIFPLGLLQEFHRPDVLPDLVNQEQLRWWVVHTRPRQEKSLARVLLKQQIAFYLPLVRRRLLIRSRPFIAHIPLFAGYIFVNGTDPDRVRALNTRRVVSAFDCHDTIRLHDNLRTIQKLIESDTPLTVESRLQPGDLVRVRGGPLEGIEGIISSRKNQTRLLIWVKMLQQGVSLEIEDYLLEPA